jgi:hypothetical protein
VLGLLVPFVLGRAWGDRWRGFAALVPMTALAAGALYGVFLLTEAAFQAA